MSGGARFGTCAAKRMLQGEARTSEIDVVSLRLVCRLLSPCRRSLRVVRWKCRTQSVETTLHVLQTRRLKPCAVAGVPLCARPQLTLRPESSWDFRESEHAPRDSCGTHIPAPHPGPVSRDGCLPHSTLGSTLGQAEPRERVYPPQVLSPQRHGFLQEERGEEELRVRQGPQL